MNNSISREDEMSTHYWIRIINIVNRLAALIAFFYILTKFGIGRASVFGILIIVAFFIVRTIGRRIDMARANNPRDLEDLDEGRMPISMLTNLIITTTVLVFLNVGLILLFTKGGI